ncbi:flagellar hook-basal body complex protein FliE [Stieleria mannarensis]|uniref:flagellar hook-basal body complex protein FliE n=1 Tax=Stieleria mannarensis TaxID=2755585 RepID=UPI001600F80D|nr:flagellar hook-basal body complex protein FliE [Rhodopirellula sp. JC639]
MSALPPIATTGSANVALPSSPAKPEATDRNLFMDLMARANEDQIRSEEAIQGLVSGENQDVQQVVMEVVKAEMSFQIFMEVRNQIVDSYNELMRMQF